MLICVKRAELIYANVCKTRRLFRPCLQLQGRVSTLNPGRLNLAKKLQINFRDIVLSKFRKRKKNQIHIIQDCRKQWGPGGPRVIGRPVNPISTGGGRGTLCPPHYYVPPLPRFSDLATALLQTTENMIECYLSLEPNYYLIEANDYDYFLSVIIIIAK